MKHELRPIVVRIHLHECNEQEKGIGRPPDLLIEEPRQKGENSILGGAAKKDGDKRRVYIQNKVEASKALANAEKKSRINCVLMAFLT